MKRVYNNIIYAATLDQMIHSDKRFIYISGLEGMTCPTCNKSLGQHGQFMHKDAYKKGYKIICPTSMVILDQQHNVLEIIDNELFQRLYKYSNQTDEITSYLIDKYSTNNTSPEEIIIETIKMLFES